MLHAPCACETGTTPLTSDFRPLISGIRPPWLDYEHEHEHEFFIRAS